MCGVHFVRQGVISGLGWTSYTPMCIANPIYIATLTRITPVIILTVLILQARDTNVRTYASIIKVNPKFARFEFTVHGSVEKSRAPRETRGVLNILGIARYRARVLIEIHHRARDRMHYVREPRQRIRAESSRHLSATCHRDFD